MMYSFTSILESDEPESRVLLFFLPNTLLIYNGKKRKKSSEFSYGVSTLTAEYMPVCVCVCVPDVVSVLSSAKIYLPFRHRKMTEQERGLLYALFFLYK
jgi:hypothetical protein